MASTGIWLGGSDELGGAEPASASSSELHGSTGTVALRAIERSIHPHLSACLSAAERMAWHWRTVWPVRVNLVQPRPVPGVEIVSAEHRQRRSPRAGSDGVLDLRNDTRRWWRVARLELDVVEPAVEQSTDGRARERSNFPSPTSVTSFAKALRAADLEP